MISSKCVVILSFLATIKACVPSETTVKSPENYIESFCSGDLIFKDNFDTLSRSN
jgi:hypothetical protein